MHKYTTFAAICLMLIGCRNSAQQPTATDSSLSHRGKFLVPEEELPRQVVKLAEQFCKLPTISSHREFRWVLTKCGINEDPDYYKDNGHFWFLGRDFVSETDPEKRFYRVAIGLMPSRNEGIVFHWATISREDHTEPRTKKLWEINWMESAEQTAK